MNILSKLTYRPEVMRMARSVGVSAILRSCYFRVKAPRGIARLGFHGVNARFRVQNSQDLRNLEDIFLQERPFLETLMNDLRPGEVFFDVGGHIGLFTVFLALAVGPQGQVVAFEPSEKLGRKLADNVNLNLLSKVRIFQKALGEQNTTGSLLAAGSCCPALLPDVAAARHRAGTMREANGDKTAPEAGVENIPTTFSETVDVVQGDGLSEREKLPLPNAIKIDVEGYEYFVLQGLRKTLSDPRCRLICCEIHPNYLPSGVNADMVLELVRTMGFTDIDTRTHLRQLHMTAAKPRAGN